MGLSIDSPIFHEQNIKRIQRFRAKSLSRTDPGWIPVRVKETRQNKKQESRF
jgi:hypothetical protein